MGGGKREREREMGGEQRNWKMKEGLERGQDEKTKREKGEREEEEEEEGGKVAVFC